MKKENLRIVYMGTPDFAVEALRQLVEGGYNVVEQKKEKGLRIRSCLTGAILSRYALMVLLNCSDTFIVYHF